MKKIDEQFLLKFAQFVVSTPTEELIGCFHIISEEMRLRVEEDKKAQKTTEMKEQEKPTQPPPELKRWSIN